MDPVLEEAAEQLGYLGARFCSMAMDRGLIEATGGPAMTAAEHELKYGHQFPKTLNDYRDQKWREKIEVTS